MAHRHASIDDLGDGVFRKLRLGLGITAFGANVLVLPAWHRMVQPLPRTAGRALLRAPQQGRIRCGWGGDGSEPGGACYVESTAPRRFWNAGDEELVLLAIGGKDGYVERDGQMVDPADVERRRAVAAGDLSVIRRR